VIGQPAHRALQDILNVTLRFNAVHALDLPVSGRTGSGLLRRHQSAKRQMPRASLARSLGHLRLALWRDLLPNDGIGTENRRN
jgi:hypothetical protein